MKFFVAILLAVFLFAVQEADARPATTTEKTVFVLAQKQLAKRGIVVNLPEIFVDSGGTRTCPSEAYMCTWFPWASPSYIVMDPDAAADARKLHRITKLTNLTNRRIAFRNSYWTVMTVLAAGAHELVHVKRGQVVNGQWQRNWLEEGLAEAVAKDQGCALEQSIIRMMRIEYGVFACRRMLLDYAYVGWTARVRRLSATETGTLWTSQIARAWRERRVLIP